MIDTAPLDLRFQGWRTSSYSEANGNSDCVAVAYSTNAIGVRDSKSPDPQVLAFSGPAWRKFLAGSIAA